MSDRTGHLAGFDDDYKKIKPSKKEPSDVAIYLYPCSGCPSERHKKPCLNATDCRTWMAWIATSPFTTQN